MKARPLALLCTLLAALILFRLAATFGHEEFDLSYAFHVPGDGNGHMTIDAVIRPAPPHSLRFNGLLRDRILNAQVESAVDSAGRTWSVQMEKKAIESPVGPIYFTFFILAPPAEGKTTDSLYLRYSVAPGTRATEVPCGEERHVAVIDDGMAAFDATSSLLLPDARIASIAFDPIIPDSYSIVSRFPKRILDPKQEDLLLTALVAAPLERIALAPELADSVRLHVDQQVESRTSDAIARLLTELAKWLSPPSEPLDVVCLARRQDGVRLAIPSVPGMVVCDMNTPDIASLRDMLRRVVLTWLGVGAPEASTRTPWFQYGLANYLAMLLPEKLGYANSVAADSIEYTWILEREHANIRLDPEGLRAPATPPVRIKATTAILELDRMLSNQGGLASFTKELGASSIPRGLLQTPELNTLAQRGLIENGRFDFEERWSLPTEERASNPSKKHTLTLVFTANTEGHVENCGCRGAQSGGLSRRAAQLDSLRQRLPDLVAIDLGGILPVEPRRAVLDPVVERSIGVTVSALERMKYEVVCAGPSDAFYGADVFKNAFGSSRVAAVCGTVSNNGALLGNRTHLFCVADLRVAVYSIVAKLEHGTIHETQEQNTQGLSYALDLPRCLEDLRELRSQADITIVVGSIPPQVANAIVEAKVGVTLILSATAVDLSRSHTWISGVPFAWDVIGKFGLTLVELDMDVAHAPVACRVSPQELPEGAPKSSEIEQLLRTHYAATTRSVCLECHDSDHSEAFETRFEEAWAKVRHVVAEQQ